MKPGITAMARLGWSERQISFPCSRFLTLMAVLVLGFPGSGTAVNRAENPAQQVAAKAVPPVPVAPTVAKVSPALRSMEGFLKLHRVSEADRNRLAKSLLASAKKYDLNPKLLASVMIVESRGNPFAVSGQNAVGLMQIHLPTWGETADREDINLFKIEDNIDFGARILQGYVRRFGVWDGVKHYNGFIAGDPIWEESAQRYLLKVQEVGGFQESVQVREPAASVPGKSDSLQGV